VRFLSHAVRRGEIGVTNWGQALNLDVSNSSAFDERRAEKGSGLSIRLSQIILGGAQGRVISVIGRDDPFVAFSAQFSDFSE
jgi:hypothetical protein